MEERVFLDKSLKPTEQSIQLSLGSAAVYYGKILDIASACAHTWNFTKGSGWMLKVSDRKKALFYLIPLKEKLKISLAMREQERAAFLQDNELTALHPAIASSRKYAEGFALQFTIEDATGFDMFERFARKLMGMRSGATARQGAR